MRPRDTQRADELEAALLSFSAKVRPLPGIKPFENRATLIEQFLESIRRVQYVAVIREKNHSMLRADPCSEIFDPIRAAAIHCQNGSLDEACWLVFLATHFGKHKSTEWRLVQDIYGALGNRQEQWTWQRISQEPDGLSRWLAEKYGVLTGDGVARHFGNHRKYETLRPSSSKGTGAVVESYVGWVHQYGDHLGLFTNAIEGAAGDSRKAFRILYDSMEVLRFGRTAKFDYLTMLAKLRLAPIQADSAYLVGATGPLRGARLLLGGSVGATNLTALDLDPWLIQLGDALGLGMQEIEDALCNWQKAPARFARFRG